jgi:hypothetical protein
VRRSGVAGGIAVLALLLFLADLVVTRPPEDPARIARAAAEARARAVATAGPLAGLTVPVQPGTVPGARDTTAVCRAVRTGAVPPTDGTVQVLPAGIYPIPVTSNTLRHDAPYRVGGWAIAPAPGAPLRGVCLVLDGAIRTGPTSLYGSPRPDVGAAYDREDAVMSGYEIRIPPRALPPGEHDLRVAAVTGDGSLRLLPQSIRITVR